jgi:hypothetical protein
MLLRTFKANCASPEKPEKGEGPSLKISNVKLHIDEDVPAELVKCYDKEAGASSIKQAAETKVFEKVTL